MYSREQAGKHAEILAAFADGAPIQMKDEDGEWEDVYTLLSINPDAEYRIQQIAPHSASTPLIGRVIFAKDTSYHTRYLIIGQDQGGIWAAVGYITYSDLLDNWIFGDGSPCGTIV